MGRRVIALDTETTGLYASKGHRIVEIGCVELVDMRKGETRQWYINPERDIPIEVTKIHGITNEKVAHEPIFSKMVDEFLDFIGDDTLVIHNAAFDMGFLNAELQKLQREVLGFERVMDTVELARKKFPGATASLDALCRRFKIDNTHRTFHGALLDSDLLADVYVELMGGNQLSLDFPDQRLESSDHLQDIPETDLRRFPVRNWAVPKEELSAHHAFLKQLQQKSGACIWLSVHG